MSLWQQNYDPAGNIWLSSLIASLPILFFFFALIKLKLKGYLAATYTVAIALLVALFFYKMPVDRALASVVYGFFYGLWPIAWIIIAAVFVYKISVKTGQFDIIRSSILSITPDQRLQMLIVGFSFGAFLEGAAGFGAPVAITAALLVGLGFNPLYAAGLCLIVNTAPVAFGAMGIPPFKALFAPGGALYDMVINISVPFLDKMVARMPPVVHDATPYAAVFKFDWFSATGTAILFAAILSVVWLRMKPAAAVQTFAATIKELMLPIYSIGMVLAFAFISNYSGLSSTLALALAHTGHAFTFFSPFLGWLGVFLTGSDTSSNALFAALQATAAQQIGVSDVLLVAANTTGGVTGKMISPQSIAIACAAVGLVGKESDLFRFTVKHSLIFTCMVGVITTLQAYVLTWMIP
ncbi:L-lactate permease [Enterobacter hormaechei subsp. steigerwaltii]|uniref:L-lactate permease n=1 Tax=Enterobacter hormaechei TaxID=158836 RepID=UPI00075889B9|nr:L-lactate permease [Enterobacter hormaechei]KVJ38622.1 L-lactate permease [Enterobacter hormaechei subsp. steigerwaltii]